MSDLVIRRIAAALQVSPERAKRFYAAAQKVRDGLKEREGRRSLETFAVAIGHAVMDDWGHISRRRKAALKAWATSKKLRAIHAKAKAKKRAAA